VAVHEGYISVTPLQVDLTNYNLLKNSCLPQFNWP
jgi:broad specificity polyphosphatase/5'/3'-nucleotidase SurE